MALRRREFTALLLGGAAALGLAGRAAAEGDPLPSWNDGPAKDAIVKFVHATTDAASPDFVPVAERIATFDQDGTLWVEHPIYTQIVFAFSRVPEVVKERPELAKEEPAFKADPLRRPRGDREPFDGGASFRRRRDLDRHGCRDLPRRGRSLDQGRARSALEATLHRPRLSAADRAPQISARQRLPDLHRDRRRPGFRPRLFRAGLRRSGRAGDRNHVRPRLQAGSGRQARPRPGKPSSSSTTTRPASPRASIS